MNAFKELSETEMEIMEVLWESSEAKTFAWLLEFFNTEKAREWKKQTMSTYMLRLQDKGVVCSVRVGRTFEYSPAMTKNEYESAKAKGFLETAFGGSVKNFVAALYDGNGVTRDEMNELKKWLLEQSDMG